MEVQRRVAVHGLPGENLSFGHGGLQLSNGIILAQRGASPAAASDRMS